LDFGQDQFVVDADILMDLCWSQRS